ncbi:MAG: hypothetical protein CMB80_05405 [Flammeovirgaceae bacterium]|nr:hypothetical protein [Flammeovirgaceae bacterium]MAH32753.1 hypothetical protein [Marinobacter sp.]|tara:strand:+ start:759 stop:1013 length:255 start_codon:yes stop_codon:yes gene_type:complete
MKKLIYFVLSAIGCLVALHVLLFLALSSFDMFLTLMIFGAMIFNEVELRKKKKKLGATQIPWAVNTKRIALHLALLIVLVAIWT